ncbi:zinc-ribbon domain-containing protein [Escherichia coli]|uniref:zinc-ribbon domain-containing protein n=1 Tax=Escherichia coli TaxID=562 RepID=UPI00202BB1A9|nr:GIY-YIG nuclease family protein [Escherichia coli]
MTHEEHITAIAKVNPNVEVLGEIINCITKVPCRCRVCNHEWCTKPNTLKNGHGCPKCGGTMKLSHDEQVLAIAKINPNVEILGKIDNNTTKVPCRCKVCNCEFQSRPHDLKRGHGCPRCAYENIAQLSKLSHEKQVELITKCNKHIDVLGRIDGTNKKVLCGCRICDHKWLATPSHLRHGRGCPKCAKLKQGKRLTSDEHLNAIYKVNHNVKVLGEIGSATEKVKCYCKVCEYTWNTKPSRLKSGHGCPRCAKSGFLSRERGKLYIMADDLEAPTMMKIGVSINENKRRNEVFKSALKAGAGIPTLHVVKIWEGATKEMFEIEQAMHKAFSNYKINFPVKFDGSNEFFYYRPEVFDIIEAARRKIVNKNAA